MLSEYLAQFFWDQGYTWTIDGKQQSPTSGDIQKALEHMKEVLEKEPGENVQLELGRLIAKKREGVIDIFVHIGELND